jgi:hypothetical protein
MASEVRYELDWFTEDKCKRCGVCCGSQDGHPCEHLMKDGERYLCAIYNGRFGIHRTTTGRVFRCVSIREIIDSTGGFPGCGYRKPAPVEVRQPAAPVPKETH